MVGRIGKKKTNWLTTHLEEHLKFSPTLRKWHVEKTDNKFALVGAMVGSGETLKISQGISLIRWSSERIFRKPNPRSRNYSYDLHSVWQVTFGLPAVGSGLQV